MTNLKYPYTNFEKSSIRFKKCTGCKKNCKLLYDSHHDQHFSYTCGRVIMQSNTYETTYTTDPLYWEKLQQKRKETQDLRKIISKLKEINIKYTPHPDRTIAVTFTKEKEYDEIAYLCEKTDFIIITKFHHDIHDHITGRTDTIIPERKKGDYI